MREQQIQTDILLEFGSRPDVRLWRCNVIVAKTPEGGRIRSLPKGHPDIAGILAGGRALYIEVKSATGRLSKEQTAFRDMALGLGALWVLARSVQDVHDAIQKHPDKA